MPHIPGHQKTNEEVLAESTKVAQEAARVAGLGEFTQGVGVSGGTLTNPNALPVPQTGPVNSNILRDTTSVNVEEFNPSDVTFPDVSSIDTTLPDTPFTDGSEDLLTQFLKDQQSLAGEDEFRQQQREEFGVSDLRTQQEDLVASIRAGQIKSKQLENERALIAERVQQASTGRGRTVGGIAPLVAADERSLALRQSQVTSQVLTDLATLSAVEGKLGTAQRQVEEAVEARFGEFIRRKERILETLDVLQKSGVLTREQERRAEARKAIEDQEKRELEDQAAEQQAIWEIGVNAATIAAKKGISDPILINQIQKAGSKEEALQLALDGGLVSEQDLQFQTEEVGGRIVRFAFDSQGNIVGQTDLGSSGGGVGSSKEKPASPAERKILGFFNRMKVSDENALQVEQEILDSGTLAQFAVTSAPEFTLNETQKLYKQAQREFTEARLRQESGAAIPDSEFENDALTYFVQPNDTQEVINRKREARKRVAAGLAFSSGAAFEEFYGFEFDSSQLNQSVQPVGETLGIGDTGTLSSGITFIVEEE